MICFLHKLYCDVVHPLFKCLCILSFIALKIILELLKIDITEWQVRQILLKAVKVSKKGEAQSKLAGILLFILALFLLDFKLSFKLMCCYMKHFY